MKKYKNVSKKKLSIGNDLVNPGTVKFFDESNESVKFFEKSGYLQYVPEEEEKSVSSPISMDREPAAASAAPSGDERPEVAETRGSTTATGTSQTQAPASQSRTYSFANDEGTVISRGIVPGAGSEKPVSDFMKDAITAGSQDLGSILSKQGVVAEEPKKK